jgi:DNA-binding NtrC family response regulator
VSSPKNSAMIVNDNTDLVELFKIALEHQGFETFTSTDPTLALKKIKTDPNQFYLIIINYASQLKQFRGKLAKEVKAINENIKVVLSESVPRTFQIMAMMSFYNSP